MGGDGAGISGSNRSRGVRENFCWVISLVGIEIFGGGAISRWKD